MRAIGVLAVAGVAFVALLQLVRPPIPSKSATATAGAAALRTTFVLGLAPASLPGGGCSEDRVTKPRPRRQTLMACNEIPKAVIVRL
jgi:hypothetical protein